VTDLEARRAALPRCETCLWWDNQFANDAKPWGFCRLTHDSERRGPKRAADYCSHHSDLRPVGPGELAGAAFWEWLRNEVPRLVETMPEWKRRANEAVVHPSRASTIIE